MFNVIYYIIITIYIFSLFRTRSKKILKNQRTDENNGAPQWDHIVRIHLWMTILRRTDTKQLCRATIACNPATQPTQCLTMTCKGFTARVARQDCVTKLLRVCPPLRRLQASQSSPETPCYLVPVLCLSVTLSIGNCKKTTIDHPHKKIFSHLAQ